MQLTYEAKRFAIRKCAMMLIRNTNDKIISLYIHVL